MKITAGLASLEGYLPLADAGADEMFAGFVPLDWLEKYANFTPLNRREVLMHDIQFAAMDDMRLLARMMRDRGVPVALTFNSIAYLPEQYEPICDLLEALGNLGFQDWIIADPALLLHLRRRELPGRIHLSGEAGIFSPDALRFFLRFHPTRLIFPRKVTPEEMAAIIRSCPSLEYEAFALNERCHYSGAYCCSLHCDELEQICNIPFRPDGLNMPEPADTDPGQFGAGGCALCALPRLEQAGVTHLKVVGRGARMQDMLRDVRLLRRALAEGCDYAALTGTDCAHNCYYP